MLSANSGHAEMRSNSPLARDLKPCDTPDTSSLQQYYYMPVAVLLIIIPHSIKFQRLASRFVKEFIERERRLRKWRGSQLLLQAVQRFECRQLPHGQKL